MSKASHTKITILLGQMQMVLRCPRTIEEVDAEFKNAHKQGGLAFIKVADNDRERIQIINPRNLTFIELSELYAHEPLDDRPVKLPNSQIQQ